MTLVTGLPAAPVRYGRCRKAGGLHHITGRPPPGNLMPGTDDDDDDDGPEPEDQSELFEE